MTVKELKVMLDKADDDAPIYIKRIKEPETGRMI